MSGRATDAAITLRSTLDGWTKTAEEILDSLARFCRRISGASHEVLFMVVAEMAEIEPESIHERTLIGLDIAAANGNHGGWPPVVDADMLTVALSRRNGMEFSRGRRPGAGRAAHVRQIVARSFSVNLRHCRARIQIVARRGGVVVRSSGEVPTGP
ncbi:hypothetical protein [Streptomyces sp. NBC_00358]|uniref:hypothetical protein n=1 Tax=Streptomyces sp. NBC_00358 TaxID=2975725 RepID=UPI002E25942C